EDTEEGTQTDFDGNYTIKVEEGSSLVFSYVGYEDIAEIVAKEEIIDVKMKEGQSLDEIVVVGYGREEKRDLVGAISQVESSDVEDMPVSNVERRLQGKVPGLRINQNRGEPGGQMSMQIRGAASINSGNEPLVVIDGFPSEEGLADINP